MEYLWVYLCIAASFFGALNWGLNGIFKANPIRLGFYRSAYVTVLLSPLLFIVDLPSDQLFYFGFFVMGLFGIIADMLVFNIVKKYTGSGPTRVMNLRVPITIVIGWLMFPESWAVISEQGQLAELAVIACLIVTMLALFFMTKNPIAGNVLYLMITPIAIYISIDLFTKYLFAGSELSTSATYLSVWVLASGMLLGSLISSQLTRTKLYVKTEPVFKHAFYVMLAWLGIMCSKQLAFYYIPNPGYYSLFIGLSCLWVMLYHKLKGQKDESSPVAGMVLVIGSIILTLIVS